MRAIILAAGRGSRMKKLTDETPKCLVKLRGRPLLEWQLEALRSGGADDIAIVTGYRRETLAPWGLREFHNPRWAETNMVFSLMQAAGLLEREPCLVSYSDIFYDTMAVTALRECRADIAITYDANWRALWTKRFGDPLLDAESFRLNADGTVAEIGRRPESVEDVQGQYMGLLRFSPAGWAELVRLYRDLPPETRDTTHMTGMLQRLIEAGRLPVLAVPYEGEWGEVDTESDLLHYGCR